MFNVMNKKKFILLLLLLCALIVQSCAVAITEEQRQMNKRRIHQCEFDPYLTRNTIEGYREFISRYPDNMFVGTAEARIVDLEFAPYDKANTLEGYKEFKKKHPKNPHITRADARIEQFEFKPYEKSDSIQGYKEYLDRRPDGLFALLAKDRLQDLEFREFAVTLEKKYGFDLLLYRLNLKRLKKRISASHSPELAEFTPFASIAHNDGRKYFHTHILYSPSVSAGQDAQKVFDSIISWALPYLDNKFMKKQKIDGFSFDIGLSKHLFFGDRKILHEFFFPLNAVAKYAKSTIDKKELFEQSLAIYNKNEQ